MTNITATALHCVGRHATLEQPLHHNAGPSRLKIHASAADAAAAFPPPVSIPQKENAPPDSSASPLQGLSMPFSSQQLQQQPVTPSATHTPNSHHRVSLLPAAGSSAIAQQQGSGDQNTPSAKQEVFWVGQSSNASSDPDIRVSAAGRYGVEAVGDAGAAAEAVSSQLEGLQLTPLKQLLKLCGQQVCLSPCCWCVLQASVGLVDVWNICAAGMMMI